MLEMLRRDFLCRRSLSCAGGAGYLRGMQEVFEDVACNLCGCVCDDLRITVRGNRIVEAEGACSLAEPWLLAQNSRTPPVATSAGQPLPLEAAFDRAAEILRAAKAPLIYGLSRSSTAGQQAAVALADLLGATIDNTASPSHAGSLIALQQAGLSTCSLGEVRHHADLIVYWGSNPVVSHPRHLARYSADSRGEFVASGRAGRTLVVVDVHATETSARADLFLKVEPGRDFEALWALRTLLAGLKVDAATAGGIPLDDLRELAERLRRCRAGAIFYGAGIARHGNAHATTEALFRLVRDLNRFTRFYARRMRPPGDASGADSVLCWQTGFAGSVNLARGYPRYSPGEYSAEALLARGEVDACLIVGSESITPLSPAAQQRLASIPTIVLDYPLADIPAINPSLIPAVRFTTAVYGIHRPGTAYRMDDVPLPLRSVLTSPYSSDDEILRSLIARLSRQ